ncbi:MAG: phenylalanine--tRNA ligase subunit beta [Thermacetogeniaceae bacterium]
MRISYKWLKEYVECDLPPEELAERLTMAGIPVEGVAPPVPGLSQIVVGRIEEICPHPNSDHLKICRVDVGGEMLQLVSGAPNLSEGLNVAVAKPGVTLKDGVTVECKVLRGEKSEGIICSGAELGTDEWGFGDDKGVLILDPAVAPGTPLDIALGLDDYIFEFELTPNRGDCLSAINLAREIRALTGGRMKLPCVCVRESGEKTADMIKVKVAEPELCRRYAARIIRDVRIAPSPHWLQYRLRSAGIRPINNIVDVTNYVMLETGQPLHAFDYDKLHDRQIIVRRPYAGEKMVFLDGVLRELEPEMLVIADAREPVALAGVMGGLASEVTESTRTVLLESAHFDPLNIRMTAKKLGLRTEAAQRFEKGVNINGAVRALDRAAHLIEELGAGIATAGVVDEYVRPEAPLTIRLRTARVNRVLGTNLDRAAVQEILSRLDFTSELCGHDALLVNIPSYRQDIRQEIDLIEEVARLYGYDRIEPTIPVGVLGQGTRSQRQRLRELITEVMVGAGLNEVITYSFIGECSLEKLGLLDSKTAERLVRIQNPLREDQGVLRPSLLPGLVNTISLNYKRKQVDLGIFELGAVFESRGSEELPLEKLRLGMAACGKMERGWLEPVQERDFYYIKGIVEELFEVLGVRGVSYQPWKNTLTLHPGRAAQIFVGSELVGFLGELHPDVLERYDLPLRVVVAELDLEALLPLVDLKTVFQPLPRFPGIYRDLAVVVPVEIPAEKIRAAIIESGDSLLRECHLFDVYQGPQLPSGYRSLAFSLLFQSQHRTLTDEEVTEICGRILKELEIRYGARLR